MSEFEDWTKTYKAKPIAPPSDHIVDANKKVEPVARVSSIRNDIGYGTIAILKKDGLSPSDYLYTRPAPPSELLMAAEDVLELFLRVWISDDGINLTPDEKEKLNALRIELNKFK